MTPFTADSKILSEALGPDSALWKTLTSAIKTIQLSDRSQTKISESKFTQHFRLHIETEGETQIFLVSATWDYMNLENVEVVSEGSSP